jgi:hypothetical protein
MEHLGLVFADLVDAGPEVIASAADLIHAGLLDTLDDVFELEAAAKAVKLIFDVDPLFLWVVVPDFRSAIPQQYS